MNRADDLVPLYAEGASLGFGAFLVVAEKVAPRMVTTAEKEGNLWQKIGTNEQSYTIRRKKMDFAPILSLLAFQERTPMDGSAFSERKQRKLYETLKCPHR